MKDINGLTDFLNNGNTLNTNQTKNVFCDIMSDRIKTEDLKNFLLALKGKETPDTITGAAIAMRNVMEKIDVRNYPEEIVLDTCGTGGTDYYTFNISTAAAFVIAGCGIKVAKHGNRAVSSRFGSSDVLRELGLNLNLSPLKVCEIIKEIGIGFLFAPLYHPAMKYVAQAREDIAQKTIFNIIGPLCNPAGANVQVVGVYEETLLNIIIKVLNNLGAKHAFTVYSPKGLDEVSIEGKTTIVKLEEGKISPLCQINPLDFGIKESSLKEIAPGKNSEENAKIILDILNGEKSARTDIVLINSALGIVATGKTDDLKEATSIARESILSGKALKKLNSLIGY